MTDHAASDARVLLLAPTARDAEFTSKILADSRIVPVICHTLRDVCDGIERGADAALLTQEAILADRDSLLERTLYHQPAWSDFPLVVLAPPGVQTVETGRVLDAVGNMTLVSRPIYVATLLSAVRAALRDRWRQYDRRDFMDKQKESEAALIAARNAAEAANIAKTEFLANMSHEIRTPMNAVIGLAHILAMSKPLTARQQEYIKTLQMSADALMALINDLLDIAKIEAQTLELEQVPFSLERLIDDVATMLAVKVREKGLSFTSDCTAAEGRMFTGDPTRLRQILLNLCGNAMKFTEKGGIHVAIGCDDLDDGRVETRIAVRDTGIGIPEDKQASVFDKFVQADASISRKYGGTGLGLTITKTLTEIMDGRIELDSKPGEGSCFTVVIPLRVAESAVAAADGGARPARHGNGEAKARVLLVEDNAANVLVASSFLEAFGFEAEVAVDGQEALDKLQAGGDYALVLMDVQMPGMNGLDCTRRIRELEAQQGRGRLPVIGMTAHALSGDRERCLAAGMDDYIAKPFTPGELRARLETRARMAEA